MGDVNAGLAGWDRTPPKLYRVGLALRANLVAFIRGLRPRVGARLRLDLLYKEDAAKPRPYLPPDSILQPTIPLCCLLCNPYSVLCSLTSPLHLCTGHRPICTFARLAQLLRTLSSAFTFPLFHRSSAPICTFAPFGSFPLSSILQPTSPLHWLFCTPYSVICPATPLPILVFNFAPLHRP